MAKNPFVFLIKKKISFFLKKNIKKHIFYIFLIRKNQEKGKKVKEILIILKTAKMSQNEPKMNRNEPSFILFLFFSMNQNEPKIVIYQIKPK